jgi:hypothetical protein
LIDALGLDGARAAIVRPAGTAGLFCMTAPVALLRAIAGSASAIPNAHRQVRSSAASPSASTNRNIHLAGDAIETHQQGFSPIVLLR